MMTIVFSVAILGALAAVFGLGLGYAGVKFQVPEDERVALVRGFLPGANCGGCGYPGCDGLASAIAAGEAATNACPVGGDEIAAAIAEVMGVKAVTGEKKAAFVKCGGSKLNSKYNYEYAGLNSCLAASQLTNAGAKACRYGCIGAGSCANACKFGAITFADGLAVIDSEKCTSCGLCVSACPKNLVELVPVKSAVKVRCNSGDNGKTVRANCPAGCIGCKICEKACAAGAIKVENFLAKIDYDKCTNCGECAKKCPNKTIKAVG
jgi:Na+-translocating ferredoxin:NAD+ oxidoreductase RNF subunit RnfB